MGNTSTIAFKTDAITRKAIEDLAKKRGLTLSETVHQIVSQNVYIDELVSDILKTFCKAFNSSPPLVAAALIIDFAAKRQAEIENLGRQLYSNNPFVFDSIDGHQITGDELFQLLKKSYQHELLMDEHFCGRAKDHLDRRRAELRKKYGTAKSARKTKPEPKMKALSMGR